jgi:hypothetical protein
MNECNDYIPVPEEFWSFETGRPMAQCSLCGCDLMADGTNYLIEKAFIRGETIFEHALCLGCHAKCVSELSQESLQRIQNYFAEHVDMEEYRTTSLERFGTDHTQWISHCMVKGYPIRECEEYQLYGFCIDSDLMFNGTPYALSGEAIDEIMQLMSNQTLGAMADLSDRLFGIDAPKDLLVF